MKEAVYGSKGGSHVLARFVDQSEGYGAHVVERMVSRLPSVRFAVDVGAAGGRDISTVKRFHPDARTAGIEANPGYASKLRAIVDEVHGTNIEREPLPFSDETVDLFIANQIMEHTKEVFWIFHELTRALKVGGHLLIGVPNIASFHNRILLVAGQQPTQHKLCSAHVRPFSKRDTLKFLDACFPGGYTLSAFAGAQFYPFPAAIARPLAGLFPAACVSIFFLLQKRKAYGDSFVTYPGRANLQTNFYCGENRTAWGERTY